MRRFLRRLFISYWSRLTFKSSNLGSRCHFGCGPPVFTGSRHTGPLDFPLNNWVVRIWSRSPVTKTMADIKFSMFTASQKERRERKRTKWHIQTKTTKRIHKTSWRKRRISSRRLRTSGSGTRITSCLTIKRQAKSIFYVGRWSLATGGTRMKTNEISAWGQGVLGRRTDGRRKLYKFIRKVTRSGYWTPGGLSPLPFLEGSMGWMGWEHTK